MRDILFRGKSERLGWVYSYYWQNGCGNHFIRRAVDNNGCICIEDIEVDPETVGQYTGLCDKNGKKIFEGDIVRLDSDGEKYEVFFMGNGEYSYVLFSARYYRIEHIYELENRSGVLDAEIIGNIHDNPELL